ncbi:MAG: hypothetical protein U0746_18415 [Gemmataceae bacterium]
MKSGDCFTPPPNNGVVEYYPTPAAKGGLRLARTGATVRFFASDGTGPYRELHSADYGDMPLREVGVFVDTGGALTEMSVLLKSLTIRGPNLIIDEDYPAPEPKPNWWGLAGVLGVGVVPFLAVAASRMRARLTKAKA